MATHRRDPLGNSHRAPTPLSVFGEKMEECVNMDATVQGKE